MSDDEKPIDAGTDLPEAVEPTVTTSPAVHGDTLWDGPRWIENAQREPVWCETKAEYMALLNRNGKRMQNMQESSTGPEQVPVVEPLPLSLQPTPPPDPLTKEEARCMAAMSTIYRRYGLREALYCQRCATRNRADGCAVIIYEREVSIRCRCGKAAYNAPVGTTDLVIDHLANSPVKEWDKTQASILTGSVASSVPAIILNKTEALIIRSYAKMMHRREYEPRIFHPNGCWDGRTLDHDSYGVGLKVTDDEIILLCPCRVILEGSTGNKTVH